MAKTVNLVIGGRSFTFSALTLGEIRALEATLKAIADSTISGITALLAFTPHIHASIRKVHQDITPEQLEDLMGVEDLAPAQRALLEASGLKAPEPGEKSPVAA